jgi:cytoskeletal protein CcmA (bactofilin family)
MRARCVESRRSVKSARMVVEASLALPVGLVDERKGALDAEFGALTETRRATERAATESQAVRMAPRATAAEAALAAVIAAEPRRGIQSKIVQDVRAGALAGSAGACIHGDVALDNKLRVGGASSTMASDDGNVVAGYIPAIVDDMTAAKLLVSGGTYMAGSLFQRGANVKLNATNGIGMISAGEISLLSNPSGSADLDVALRLQSDDAARVVRIEAPQGVFLSSSTVGFRQDGLGACNSFDGASKHYNPILVGSYDGIQLDASNVPGMPTEWVWSAQGVAPAAGYEYDNSRLLVDGKAYFNGKLVVAGDDGARIHGDVALDNKLSVSGTITATPLSDELPNKRLTVKGDAYVSGSLHVENGFKAGNISFSDGQIVSSSGMLSLGSNSLDANSLKVTNAITATAQNHQLSDFTISNGSIVSTTPTISHGSNNLTTTGDISSTNMSFTTQLSGATATFTADCTALNFYATSDVNLKHEIRPIEGAVAQCQKLRGVEFKWKHGNDKRDQMGVIAQEVEEVYPSLVAEIDGHKRVDYSKLVGLLIEAVKELKAESAQLKQEVAELRGERYGSCMLR